MARTCNLKVQHDIGNCLKVALNDHEKIDILENIWVPDQSFTFPINPKTKLKFQLRWLDKYKWLAYSKTKSGAFCKYCVLFSQNVGVNQTLGALCIEQFTSWKRALEKFDKHQNTEYHKKSVVTATNLKLVTLNKIKSIELQLN